MMKIDLTRFRDAFFEEAAEHLATMEAGLLRLESAPEDRNLLNEVFRATHSLKGGSGTLQFSEIADIAHAMEGILDLLRIGSVRAKPPLIDLLLRGTDSITGLVKAAQGGGAPPANHGEVCADLRRALGAAKVHKEVQGNAEGPAPHASLATYAIQFVPGPDLLQRGQDPLPLLRELFALGTALEVRPKVTELPGLRDLDPTRSYLSWWILFKTDRPQQELAAVFEFAQDSCHLSISAVQGAGPPPSILTAAKPAYFGMFLVEHRYATAEQVLKALNEQAKDRPLIGRLALDAGVMTVAQVFNTLNQARGEGRLFGEVAVQLGYLTDSQLGQLLRRQQHAVPVGEILVRLGALSRDQLQTALRAFQQYADPHALDETPPVAVAPEAPPTQEGFAPANPELLDGFCAEAEEHLEAVDRDLLVLDANPTCKETLNAVYRAFHSIKGVASMFDLKAIVSLAHEAENLLNCARDGTLVLSGPTLDLAFASADGLRRQVGYVRAWMGAGGDLATDPALPGLVVQLRAALPGASPPPPAAQSFLSMPAVSPDATPEAERATQDARPAGEKETVRVDRGRLDKLINSIGELVIAQSMVQQEFDDQTKHLGLHSRALPELCKIARDLQELSLSLRMVPLQSTFQKIARVVRDLSKKIAKPVHFQVHGEETELDKTVVDRLGDPLVHMVRNAVDHGIESPEARAAAGKPAEGSVTLRAFHQGGNVHIELSDDGMGWTVRRS